MACSDRARPGLDLIPLAAIRPGDDRFRVTEACDPESLKSSVAHIGLLNPVLVRPEGLEFIPVSGRRRLAACAALGWDRIPARVLPAETPDYECACRAVGENSLERPLTLLETARSLDLLDRCHPGGSAPAADLSALGLPSARGLCDRLKRLVQLPEAVRLGIAEGAIAFPTACEMGTLAADDATAAAGLLRRLGAGLNKQREILQLLIEISRRDGTPPREVVADPLLTAAMQAAGTDSNRVTQAVRSFLRRRRFPAIAAAERNFERLRRELELGEGLQLDPPRDFEGMPFHLGCRFATLEELDRLHVRIGRLLQDPGLTAILRGKGRGFEEPC
jgi:ParB family transcriptional regulator, chromosome partitioning protein